MSNFTITRGDTYVEDWTVTDNNGVALDITGGKLYFSVKTDYSVADGSATLALTSPSTGITIVDAATGKARLLITAAQTSAMTAGLTYVYDVQFKDVNGVVTTLDKGKITVEPDVTQTTA